MSRWFRIHDSYPLRRRITRTQYVTGGLTPSIYLCVEESFRELESRILIAGLAAESGLDVVFGQQWLLAENAPHLPLGLYLFKGNNKVQHEFMAFVRRHGHLVASIEEEALGVARADQIMRLYDQDVEKDCDLFFAQGPFHRDVLVGHLAGAGDKIEVVGNPRVDFLRPAFLAHLDEERVRLRAEHGPFILFNTNCSGINSNIGDALGAYESCIRTRFFDADSRADDDLFRTLCHWERGNIGAMLRLIRRIAETPDWPSVVVRPHPSERHEVWEEALANVPRVQVVRSAAHLPWTLASEILVHTGCTTGMESVVAGHNAMSLTIEASAWHDCFVSNHVNPTFTTLNDATAFLSAVLSGRHPMAAERTRLRPALDRHVAATASDMASERIVAAVRKLLPSERGTAWRHGANLKRQRAERRRELAKMKVSLDDVSTRLSTMATTLGRFRSLDVSEIGPSLFRVGSGLR